MCLSPRLSGMIDTTGGILILETSLVYEEETGWGYSATNGSPDIPNTSFNEWKQQYISHKIKDVLLIGQTDEAGEENG
jgi:hypothetical protein